MFHFEMVESGNMVNRSVPTNVILPHVAYRNVVEAIAWLTRVFGFVEHYRYGEGEGLGAQMCLGEAWIMVTGAKGRYASPATVGFLTQSLTVFVQDIERQFERAIAMDATIVEELEETVYGELQFAALDLEGHHWIFSRHALDVAPEDWGAVVAAH